LSVLRWPARDSEDEPRNVQILKDVARKELRQRRSRRSITHMRSGTHLEARSRRFKVNGRRTGSIRRITWIEVLPAFAGWCWFAVRAGMCRRAGPDRRSPGLTT
jgi:hypothetical protein